jgi:Na+/phosphate symporter
MNVIERYGMYIETIEENQKTLKAQLAELSVKDLTEDEREYMNELMDFIKYGNTSISLANMAIKKLKRDEERLKEEA